jgi:hypothetical protein
MSSGKKKARRAQTAALQAQEALLRQAQEQQAQLFPLQLQLAQAEAGFLQDLMKLQQEVSRDPFGPRAATFFMPAATGVRQAGQRERQRLLETLPAGGQLERALRESLEREEATIQQLPLEVQRRILGTGFAGGFTRPTAAIPSVGGFAAEPGFLEMLGASLGEGIGRSIPDIFRIFRGK